ncbi:ras suppressor protein 1-like [Acanthaster planci]|uniref:Ras suppressor protein 1-like n=1 Tax=Acanthaster planci TaxID=133434 RepID=A0A8B7Y3C7_ACAPL|nr:ras suppressor protein 1-like [Acanthaster planci]
MSSLICFRPKQVEEAREHNSPDLDLSDRSISKLVDIPGLFTLKNLTRLTLSHNKLDAVPPHMIELTSLETLNLFNNYIEELPTNLSSMQNLKHLSIGMNRLYALPRGFGSFPKLEILDASYNNLTENSLPGNFFLLETLRALYLSDNDFEIIPEDIGQLTKLEVLALRDNQLIALPKAIGDLPKLKELHIQGNRLTVLPPELGKLDLYSGNTALKAENNPWVPPIASQFQVGVSHVFEYIRSETYKFLYGRHVQAGAAPPPKTNSNAKKTSRREVWGKK